MKLNKDATLIAIDTATPACSVALRHAGKRFQQIEHEQRKHTQVILPLTDRLLAEAGLGMGDVDGIVVSVGPGAFTGLRVGAAVAMGMACARDIPMLGVSSLALLAASAARAHGDGRVLALLDARMDQVYAGLYHCQAGRVTPCASERLCAPDALQDWLEQADYFAGAGCVYGFFADKGKPMYGECVPEAKDAFDILNHGQWRSAWEGVDLHYLRDEVVQS